MTDLFKLYWENTLLGPRTSRDYGQRLEQDARTPAPAQRFFYNGEDLVLGRPRNALHTLLDARQSARTFGERPLTVAELSAMLSGFAAHPDGRRRIPSAGGRYPVEVFAWLYEVEGALAGRAVYHNSDLHSLSAIGAAPPWSEARATLNWTGDSKPAAVVFFVGVPSRSMDKYGERGGRFVLMEVGHYAMTLSLALTSLGLAGCEVGGLQDRAVLGSFGLSCDEALAPLAFVCGPPAM